MPGENIFNLRSKESKTFVQNPSSSLDGGWKVETFFPSSPGASLVTGTELNNLTNQDLQPGCSVYFLWKMRVESHGDRLAAPHAVADRPCLLLSLESQL